MSIYVILLFALSIEKPAVTNNCGINNQSIDLAHQIISHPEQNRKTLKCSALLSEIAQLKAKIIASDLNQNDMTPNEFVVKQGYRFPNYYPLHGNQVEAVAKGSDPLSYLINSDKHRDHVLGLGDFFSLQTEIGIGFFKDEDPATPNQWVVLIAQPWQAPKVRYKMAPPKPVNVKDVCPSGWENSADWQLKRKCEKLDQEANQE
ncbi:hypothetical protein [Marinicella rhabdoformis]|uniref:hypothetical protein n=1 Tax=Marinicella rhabdoformis TaxID=2580566 RepID=UPI0012AEC3D7|nr:hypothetical protein [Marinicella rhabdoformis]